MEPSPYESRSIQKSEPVIASYEMTSGSYPSNLPNHLGGIVKPTNSSDVNQAKLQHGGLNQRTLAELKLSSGPQGSSNSSTVAPREGRNKPVTTQPAPVVFNHPLATEILRGGERTRRSPSNDRSRGKGPQVFSGGGLESGGSPGAGWPREGSTPEPRDAPQIGEGDTSTSCWCCYRCRR
jgi:hypothetical protein